MLLLVAQTFASDNVQPIFIDIDGLLTKADLVENTELLAKISSALPVLKTTYYKGKLDAQPNSSLRLSKNNGHWRGMIIVSDHLYRIDEIVKANGSAVTTLQAKLIDTDEGNRQLCGSTASMQTALPILTQKMQARALMANSTTAVLSAQVSASSICSNPIDGVCLLPKIEFAYDSSYQTLSSNELPIARALREINEAEMFFERSLSLRFSQLSLTMLDNTQSTQIENARVSYIEEGDINSAETLINTLRGLRSSGLLPYLENPRSIFHFVTGRNFPESPGDGNVVGIAYPGQVCQRYGLNTGLTDAGDTFLVSLVMAHEIGHNLGVHDHDDIDINDCPTNQHVMTASIGFNGWAITDFSSCSIDAITAHLTEQLPIILSTGCFDFPVDVSIKTDENNPINPPKNTAFSFVYQVDINDGHQDVEHLRVEGEIANASSGEFVGVNTNNGSCTVSKTHYSCDIVYPSDSLLLDVGLLIYEQSTSLAFSASVRSLTDGTMDMLSSNNTVSVSYQSFSNEPFLTFVPDLSTQVNVQAGSSSGGGGSVGIFSVCGLLLALYCRFRKHVRFKACH